MIIIIMIIPNKIANIGYVRIETKLSNIMISQCCKLAKNKIKTRHNLVGRVIHWELGKKLKTDHTNKWYIHNLESVLENGTYRLLWYFETQNKSPNLD